MLSWQQLDMPPVTSPIGATATADLKANFANRARSFANRVMSMQGLPIYGAASAAAVVVATAAGAFGTSSLPLAQRLIFWTLLIGLNTLLWIVWFAWRVKSPRDWWPAVLLGAIVFTLPLPFEVRATLRLVGATPGSDWHVIWFHALAICAAMLLVMVAIVAVRRRGARLRAKGRLWRAGIRSLDHVSAVAAEDHYCRIWTSDGSSRLVHGRFSDFLDELAPLDGTVVRRGHWVAAGAVEDVRRDGRRWILQVTGARSVPVASSAVAELRRRGWIGRSQ